MIRCLAALALFVIALMLSPFIRLDPLLHVLLQLPLLGVSGWLAFRQVRAKPGYALPLLFVVLTTLAYWMLPRSIDLALADWRVDLLKLASLPLLVGAPLAMAWPGLHPILRGLLKAQTISMLGVLGFLYTHAPVRICNAYLVSDQERLGQGFLAAALLLAVCWSFPVVFAKDPVPGNHNPENRNPENHDLVRHPL